MSEKHEAEMGLSQAELDSALARGRAFRNAVYGAPGAMDGASCKWCGHAPHGEECDGCLARGLRCVPATAPAAKESAPDGKEPPLEAFARGTVGPTYAGFASTPEPWPDGGPVPSSVLGASTAAPGAKEGASEAMCPQCGVPISIHTGYADDCPPPAISLPPVDLKALNAGKVAPGGITLGGVPVFPYDRCDLGGDPLWEEGAPGELSVKFLDPQTFRDDGYLQEANREFFHPLGLALVLDGLGRLWVWDYREDPEEIRFEGADLGPKALRLWHIREERRPAREAALGYWQQPVWDVAPGNSLPPMHSTLVEMIGLAAAGRCMACGWPLAKSADQGCVPGNCSFRPHGSDPGEARWRQRTQVLVLARRHFAGNIETGLPSAADLDAVAEEQKAADRTAKGQP